MVSPMSPPSNIRRLTVTNNENEVIVFNFIDYFADVTNLIDFCIVGRIFNQCSHQELWSSIENYGVSFWMVIPAKILF